MNIKFDQRSLWIGLYYNRKMQVFPRPVIVTTWFLCLVPMLPIIWQTRRHFNLTKSK